MPARRPAGTSCCVRPVRRWTNSPNGSHEVESLRPLVEAIQEAVRSGAFVELDAELLAYDLVLLAHGWALKSWYFEPQHTFDSYVRGQLRLVLAAAVAPERRRARRPASSP